MTATVGFPDLINEAYIDPIRSVMIVDDQYPTWEELLDSRRWEAIADDYRKPIAQKDWWKDSQTPYEVISALRGHDPGILVDINDGAAAPPEGDGIKPEDIQRHLHQSDLLILDYQLDGPAGDGARAVAIAKELLTKGHFNLVVLHTDQELDLPFYKILQELIAPCSKLEESQSDIEEARDLIEDNGDPNLEPQLREAFTPKLYFLVWQDARQSLSAFINGTGEFSELAKRAEAFTTNNGTLRKIFLWLVEEFEKAHGISDNDPDRSVRWTDTPESRWIRTDFGFITFAKKSDTKDLIGVLKKALTDWRPTPSRLLAAKYRHMLDEKSGITEAAVFADQLGYARFYEEISKASDPKAGSLLDDHIKRQNELTLGAIEKDIREFGQRILEADKATDDDQKFLLNYNADLEKKRYLAVLSFNHHVSMMPTYGYHLRCGHIFEFENYQWVVVTPACDLVPGQTATGFETGGNNHHRPFIALRLQPAGTKTPLSDGQISSNKFLFLEFEGQIKPYSIYPLANDEKSEVTKATWRNFVAAEDGRISEGSSFKVAHFNAADTEITVDEIELKLAEKMLRYENALHLNQLFVQTLGRVGLDFIRHNPNE